MTVSVLHSNCFFKICPCIVAFICQEFLIQSFYLSNFFPETGIHERRLIRPNILCFQGAMLFYHPFFKLIMVRMRVGLQPMLNSDDPPILF